MNIDDSVKAAGADLENLVKMPGVIEEMEKEDDVYVEYFQELI